MSEKIKDKGSAYREASALLAAALAQLSQIKRALGRSHSSELDGVAAQAMDAVMNIRSAMDSGKIDGASLASLSASLNLGVDVGALVKEAEAGPAITPTIRLAEASLESRETVERLSDEIFRKHMFDADVERHTHGAELQAFRRRQAQDERYIQEQLARQTAEGDLNASGKMEGYMLDANAHGAGDNPEFLKKWDQLKTKTDQLRAAMRAAGKSTEEYDKRIKDDVSDFLKSKGLSDQQIQEALAKNENPLGAVKPYLQGDQDSRQLTNKVTVATDLKDAANVAAVKVPKQDKLLTIDINAMNARLAAAGLAATSTGDETGHGLTIQKPRTNIIEH